MDNFGFLFAANAFVWGGIIYYVFTLKQRSRNLEKDLELLKETIDKESQ
ncbi:MAG: CcmD family protein [Nitrospinae bacterium]|nr:CcmD family protein [Nitrospinota bacterium]MZH05087.1 CcmD family protein [Nitrospinota bacterium]MZH14940.1 CcmD family protein [Nitrospinota bacterium]